MIISEIEVFTEDIMWFAVDKNGYIGMFTSSVYGNVPRFVCESREKLEQLEKYFCDELRNKTDIIITKDEYLVFDDYTELARKGLFCFDAFKDNKHIESYINVIKPLKKFKVRETPDDIKRILKDCIFEQFDFDKHDVIDVENAY
ncbi:hypothetical protein [Oceanirhabdus sp. W0125-5]|uniref:hypothetical protein n=1 Tax=Oceanirhabdus sp. W0125-5 TaxID=2999116 RepID=UPI0022F3105E|nr:hypothetical protein [Oceanirhabdus sp. W0125-5]WBW96111.1 hypothetical protein OW730_20810 [Oceanirhabdus sp. W0125-5]